MKRNELNLLCFYCWQLGIKTLGQLRAFKVATKTKTNEELLNNLAYTFNRI